MEFNTGELGKVINNTNTEFNASRLSGANKIVKKEIKIYEFNLI